MASKEKKYTSKYRLKNAGHHFFQLKDTAEVMKNRNIIGARCLRARVAGMLSIAVSTDASKQLGTTASQQPIARQAEHAQATFQLCVQLRLCLIGASKP